MNALEKIKKIGEQWFLTEPLLFAVYCSHEFTENNAMDVPLRTGNRKVEFSSRILDGLQNTTLTELLKLEMYRILLKHPYQRQPPFAVKALLTLASNITIADVQSIPTGLKKWMEGLELRVPKGLCFEEYYHLLQEQLPQDSGDNAADGSNDNTGESGGNKQENAADGSSGNSRGDKGAGSYSDSTQDGGSTGSDSSNNSQNSDSGNGSGSDKRSTQTPPKSRAAQISELWNEDQEACCDINSLIEIATANNDWGSIPGKMQGLIKASLKVDMDYRKMLSLFKTSVISSKRKLTRMRPNRRFGFSAMGSRYELTTNLLIAVDVSGSVTDKSLQFFFSVINRLFKYGIEKLDVLQFDARIQGEPQPLKKARQQVKVMGRGGTSFQPAADYYCAHPEYDGLIYFTDGYAQPPRFNTKRPIDVLWVLCQKDCYEKNQGWIKSLKRNRATYIPGNR